VILRIAAAFSLLLGSTLLFLFFAWIGESPFSTGAERHLREMKERTTAPASYAPFTFTHLAALPHGRPLTEFAPLERRGVSLEGYVYFMDLSSDGDFHMRMVSRFPGTTWPPDSLGATAELTPQWRRGSSTWQWEPLLTALRTFGRGQIPWPPGPRRARLSGWLMYDFQYDEPFVKNERPRLQPEGPGHRLTGWEIHPVTRIEIWDDSLGAYAEYTR